MKGCDLLIRAFSTIHRENPDLKLVIAGHADGGFTGKLRELARQCGVWDQVTWAGPVSEGLKWSALRSAALFALPSHCEAFPLALVEALGAGVPALITDKVNIWRHVAEAKAGFVDTDTVDGTVRSLRRWLKLSNTDERDMRKSAHACFAEQFEATANAARFVASLQRHGVANG